MTDAPDQTAERRLCDQLLTAWIGGGGDTFEELVAHALTEFDARTVVVTIISIAACFISIADDNIGWPEGTAIQIMRDNYNPQEAHDVRP